MGLHFGQGTGVKGSSAPEDLVDDSEQSNNMDVDYASGDVSSHSSDSIYELGDLQYPEESRNSLLENTPNLSSPLNSGKYWTDPPPSPPIGARPWTRYDREDLHKLGNMLSSFLEIPRFASDSKVFTNSVIAPLMDPSGPRPGSIEVLKQIMEGTMIRHRQAHG